MAQQVKDVLPDAVSERDDVYCLNYTHILTHMCQAIKELDTIVQAQAARIAAFDSKKSRISKTT